MHSVAGIPLTYKVPSPIDIISINIGGDTWILKKEIIRRRIKLRHG